MSSFVGRRARLAASGRFACCASFIVALAGAAPARGQTVSAQKVAEAPVQKTQISLEQYKSELDRISVELQKQLANPPADAKSPEQFHPAVPDAWIVDTGGQKIEVPTAGLRFQIDRKSMDGKTREEQFQRAIEQVRIMRMDAQTLLPKDPVKPDSTARAKLAEILSAREFRRANKPKSWLAQMWDRFLDWIWRLITRIFGAANNKVVQRTVLYGAIVVAFLSLAWTLVRTMSMAARRENLRLAAAPPAGKTWSQWAREAIAAANAGNYRAAIHAAYWAGIYRLAEVGTWQLDLARTPREYLRMLQRAPVVAAQQQTTPVGPSSSSNTSLPSNSLSEPSARARRAEALATLTNRLEAVWYDNQQATQQDFQIAVQNLETLECRFPSMPQTASS